MNQQSVQFLFKHFVRYWKPDLTAGLMVFLVALPLSLGIATASGFPPVAGIYTALVGGLVVTFLMPGELTIKGPAAGLIVVCYGAITELGQGDLQKGYQLALGVFIAAGTLQVLLGLLKAGKLTDVLPTPAIYGMMAAIGVIIFSRQIHIALGVQPQASEPLQLLAEIPHSLWHLNPKVAGIGLLSLGILFGCEVAPYKWARIIPPPLVVVFLGIAWSLLFGLDQAHNYHLAGLVYHIEPQEELVKLPDNLWAGMVFPSFAALQTAAGWKYVVMAALIGSIETLLLTRAVDLIDPYKRKTNMDKDLMATGVGNMLAGAIGGLPMISEIARSSANVNNHGKTRWANFYHGLFLLLVIALAAPAVHLIPYAALAALLIHTGYKLAAPREFVKSYRVGSDQLVIFSLTIFVTLQVNILVGIAAGFLSKLVLHLLVMRIPLKSLLKAKVRLREEPQDHFLVSIEGNAIFTNYLAIKKYLDRLPRRGKIVVDFSKTYFIDHTFLAHLQEYGEMVALQGAQFETCGLDNHQPFSQHPLSSRRLRLAPALPPDDSHPFSGRSRILQEFALQHGFTFRAEKTQNPFKLAQFPHATGFRVLYEENLMSRNFPQYRFKFSDLILQEVTPFGKAQRQMTVLVITPFHTELPELVLEEESFLDRVLNLSGQEDIDFRHHPAFSGHYVLKGRNPERIRRFFCEPLIQLFEAERLYSMQTHSHGLLLYEEPALLTRKEIDKMMTFATKMMQIILPEPQPAPPPKHKKAV